MAKTTTMTEMLVTEALNELKTLDSRIDRAIKTAKFIADAKTADNKVTPSKTKEDFKTEAQSSYDTIDSLIKRRDNIKAAIVASNATTTVDICGETMTVAKAIDTKASLAYKKTLLRAMKNQRDLAVSSMNSKNADLEKKIDNVVMTSFTAKDKSAVKPEDYDSIAVPMRKSGEVSLVDPLELDKKIAELEQYIEEFDATVDAKLQISNCITKIEVPA